MKTIGITLTDKELYRAGVTEFGIVLYRIKAMEVRKLKGGLWLKRVRVYHPVGLILFVILLLLTPFIALFAEETIQGVLRGVIEQFITGVKTT